MIYRADDHSAAGPGNLGVTLQAEVRIALHQ